MKAKQYISLFLILSVLFFTFTATADTVKLNKILQQFSDPRVTSLQKVDLIKQYKGQSVRGDGRVRDVVKSFGKDEKALVYLRKPYGGKNFELILTVSQESAEKIKKGRGIKFEGKFAGMTFETLRFDDAKITSKGGIDWLGWWPF